jgi:hypothetical protein
VAKPCGEAPPSTVSAWRGSPAVSPRQRPTHRRPPRAAESASQFNMWSSEKRPGPVAATEPAILVEEAVLRADRRDRVQHHGGDRARGQWRQQPDREQRSASNLRRARGHRHDERRKPSSANMAAVPRRPCRRVASLHIHGSIGPVSIAVAQGCRRPRPGWRGRHGSRRFAHSVAAMRLSASRRGGRARDRLQDR